MDDKKKNLAKEKCREQNGFERLVFKENKFGRNKEIEYANASQT